MKAHRLNLPSRFSPCGGVTGIFPRKAATHPLILLKCVIFSLDVFSYSYPRTDIRE